MSRSRVVAVLIGASVMFSGTSLALASLARPLAHMTRTVSGTATGHLHLVKADGSQLIEEGPVSGALTGSARAGLKTGAVVQGTFTIRTRAGSISGHGSGKPRGSGRYESFAGSFLATGGSGRYAHVTGSGGFYGVFDRRTDSVVVQTTGSLSY